MRHPDRGDGRAHPGDGAPRLPRHDDRAHDRAPAGHDHGERQGARDGRRARRRVRRAADAALEGPALLLVVDLALDGALVVAEGALELRQHHGLLLLDDLLRLGAAAAHPLSGAGARRFVFCRVRGATRGVVEGAARVAPGSLRRASRAGAIAALEQGG